MCDFCRFFGQLSRQEIFDLYNRYKLDHEMFSYSPEDYFKLAWDAASCEEREIWTEDKLDRCQWSTRPAHNPGQQWFFTLFFSICDGRMEGMRWTYVRTNNLCENSYHYRLRLGRPCGSTGVINDPLGQTHTHTNSDHNFRLKNFWFLCDILKRGDGRTEGRTTCVKIVITRPAVTVGQPRGSTITLSTTKTTGCSSVPVKKWTWYILTEGSMNRRKTITWSTTKTTECSSIPVKKLNILIDYWFC